MIIYEEILREFHKQKVKYVLVGGLAFNLLGGARATFDLDILVEMSDNNLRKIVNILRKQGYKVKQPVDPIGIAEKATRSEWINNKKMKAFNFYIDGGFNEVDLIIDSPVDYHAAKKDIVYVKIDNIKLPVISIDNLIKMKKRANRDIDNFDINELKKIKKLRKKYGL